MDIQPAVDTEATTSPRPPPSVSPLAHPDPAASSSQSPPPPPPLQPSTSSPAAPLFTHSSPPPPLPPLSSSGLQQRHTGPWSRASTLNPLSARSNSQEVDQDESPSWSQRLYSARHQTGKAGFIWSSLDNSMEEVQEARRTRRNGPMRLLRHRQETSYNTVRSTFRLQYAEKRQVHLKSDIRNIMTQIRLGLDYDVYKAKIMALLNSKARTILFIMVDLAVDMLFCVLYLVEAQYLIDKDKTPLPNPDWLFVPRPYEIWAIAVAMSSWNLMSALIRFVFADNKWRFIFSIQTLLDTVTAIPFLISGGFLPNGQYIYVPYFLRSWSVISRLQRALSIGVDIGISDQPFDPVKAKLIALVAYFVAILYNGMAAFLYCETMFAPEEDPHTVWDAFYFILITASTVGYGDISPKSFEGKIVVMVFIIVALSIVPGLIAGTIDTLKSSRAGGGSYIQSRGANGAVKQYLVMIGDFQNARRVSDMLSGFFNKEFSDSDVRVVFLSRNKPSKDVKTLLEMPMHKNRTTLLVGNGLDESDLKRCQVRDAGGVFVIPDRGPSGLESQDTMTTLLAWSIHIYAPDTRIFTYNLLPETETFQWGIVEQSMCIGDVKQLLLAYNCRHRGSATLILNLLHPSEPANSYADGWQAQYGDGTGNELYVTSVPDVFVGWTFAQVSWFVFQEYQSILIGVDIFLKPETNFLGVECDGPHTHDATEKLKGNKPRTSTRSIYGDLGGGSGGGGAAKGAVPSGQFHLTLNPGNSYRLGKHDQLIFIAQSPNDVDAISEFTMDQYERLLRDEKGHLDGSKVDFAQAMAMYCTLHESRASARSAARRRFVHRRRGKKAKQSHEEVLGDIHAAENWAEFGSSDHVIRGRKGSQAHSTDSKKKNTAKTFRPAWNRALYDDDDDSLSDSSSLERVRTGQSRASQDSRHSHRSDHYRRRSSSREATQAGKSKEHLVETLNSETSPRQERIQLTEAKFWAKAGKSPMGFGSLQVPAQVVIGSPTLDGTGLYPSNFDRNAAAAAAEEARGQRRSLSPASEPFLTVGGGSDAPASLGPILDIIPKTVVSEYLDKEGADSSGGDASNRPLPTILQPSHPSQATSASSRAGRNSSVQGSFQSLDESTYIGQTSVTRSETKDLPLCHLLIHPPDSVKPLIKEDLSSLKNHIVVCANAGENLYRFLATLRLAQISREDLKTIVVLTRNPLETFQSDSSIVGEVGEYDKADAVISSLGGVGIGSGGGGKEGGGPEEKCGGGNWDAILSFPRVFWISGNCRHQRDLVRAGILGASNIVVMSHSMEGLDRDEFADSTAIMSHHMIYQTLRQRDLLGRQHITVEISERTNIRFLMMRGISAEKTAQGLIAKVSRAHGGGSNGFVLTPIFASGQVLVSSLLDNVLFQAYSKTHILDLIKLCCGVRFKQAIELDQMLGIDSSNICLMDTPAQFVGQSFLKLFQALALQYGIIPLGLYRAPDEELSNIMPFVFTNPLPGILLKRTDKVYVLKS